MEDRGHEPVPFEDELRARTHAAALGVEMRSPLAQIELAVSQIARESLTPIARAHADQISHAVGQIDELVERSLRVLLPRTNRAERAIALPPVLAEQRRRFAPALAACGVQWVADAGTTASIDGDADRFRSQMCALLQFALDLCEGGGRIETTLLPRAVLSLAIARRNPLEAEPFADARRDFECLRAQMLELGGELTGELGSRSARIELTLTAGRHRDEALVLEAHDQANRTDQVQPDDQEEACPGS